MVAELAGLLAAEGGQVGAVVVEPMVQAAGGMLTHDAAFLRGVRRLCDEHGVYLICDEVATGVRRTGRMWAVEHAGISPDLLTTGRDSAGYLPLSAVLATEELYEAFLGSAESGRTFFHGHSHTANRWPPPRPLPTWSSWQPKAQSGGCRGWLSNQGPVVTSRRLRRRRGGPPDRHDDRDRGCQRRRAHRLCRLPGGPSARRGCVHSEMSSCSCRRWRSAMATSPS